MKSREEVMNILLQARFPITRIALFGSYDRGDEHEDSDVDILVDVDPSIGLKFISLAEELERLLGEPVELVSSRAVSPRMKSLSSRRTALRSRRADRLLVEDMLESMGRIAGYTAGMGRHDSLSSATSRSPARLRAAFQTRPSCP